MRAEPTRRPIVVGPKAYELRRYIGAMSWAVLEEMMQAADGQADRLVAKVSIRSLAVSLDVSKDTITRAVRRLRDLGVVEAVQARSESGSFRAGSYRLAVPEACLSIEPAALPAAAAPAACPSSARQSPSRRSSDQLSLLSEV